MDQRPMASLPRITLLTGNMMPVLGLGTWQLKKDTAGTVEYAIRIGYSMVDTSGDYGTQRGVGEGFKRSGAPREDVFIVTKVEEYENSYESSKKNLQELGLDYADLILIHRPPYRGAGENLWEGLMRAKEEGLTKDIGVSNYSIELIEKIIRSSHEIPSVNQIEWSPFGFSFEMQDYCLKKEIIIQAYSPLTRAKKLGHPVLRQLSEKYKKTPAQILIRWNIDCGTVPLPKANQKKHLEENIDLFDFELSEDDMDLLNGLNEAYSSLGSLPYL